MNANIPQEFNNFFLKDVSFVNLMTKRIFNILIVANPYDAFMLEDDGRIDEKLFDEYSELGMRYPPTFTQVSTTEEADQVLKTTDIDLVICMPGNADVLLMKAEALLRKGNADEAAQLVTQVRERNFTDHPEKAVVTGEQLKGNTAYQYGRQDTYKQTTDATVIQFGRMLDELGWEFSQEGRRRQDMVRFGAFTTLSWFSHDASDDTKNLYPIPNSQILTNGKLTQNPGY